MICFLFLKLPVRNRKLLFHSIIISYFKLTIITTCNYETDLIFVNRFHSYDRDKQRQYN